MSQTLRISTCPPNDWDGRSDEAGHYCDLNEIDDWREFPLLHQVPPPERDEVLRRGVAGYVVSGVHADCEFGLLICVEDDEEGLMYIGIDHRGRPSREPAANESLWGAGNAAQDLADGYRLERGGKDGETRPEPDPSAGQGIRFRRPEGSQSG